MLFLCLLFLQGGTSRWQLHCDTGCWGQACVGLGRALRSLLGNIQQQGAMKGNPEGLLIYIFIDIFPFACDFIESRSLKEGREGALWPFSGAWLRQGFSPSSVLAVTRA